MKRIKSAIIALCLGVTLCAAILGAVTVNANAQTEVAPLELNFADNNFYDSVTSVYVSGTGRGAIEDGGTHWTKSGNTLTRKGDLHSSDPTVNYAAMYLNNCRLRYFELNTKFKYSSGGLTGVVFGKGDIFNRHNADGNALYIMPDPCVELGGSTITVKKTSPTFSAKSGYYDLRLVVCADYVRCYIDGGIKIEAAYPSELIEAGRIGLFTANTDGSFEGGITVYNLDASGNRISMPQDVSVTGVETNKQTVQMEVGGESGNIVYSVLPASATNKNVRYLSDNPDIATADTSGKIHALKAGTANISVITEDGGFFDSVRVVVTETIPELEGITLDKSTGSIAVGEKFYLSAAIYPEDAENDGFRWSSSNTKVAIVNNGTVTAMSAGECTVTVRDYYGTYSAECKITVTEKSTQKSNSKGCKSSAGAASATAAVITLITAACVLAVRRKSNV